MDSPRRNEAPGHHGPLHVVVLDRYGEDHSRAVPLLAAVGVICSQRMESSCRHVWHEPVSSVDSEKA